MREYWWSSRQAYFHLIGNHASNQLLPEEIPDTFRLMRPWINHGWEMVLMAAELAHPESILIKSGWKFFTDQYSLSCQKALQSRGWTSKELQTALDYVRYQELTKNRSGWLSLHQPFREVVERLSSLDSEGFDLAVLTTKGKDFTSELLDNFHLAPHLLYGHESGSKTQVLLELATKRSLQGFIEDRLETLKTIRGNPKLNHLPCYLASWGYLKPEDSQELPRGIHLLKPETLAAPLARWK